MFFSVIFAVNMSRTPLIPTIIATGLGSGFAPKAPGTAGAILATIMWFAASYLLEPTTLVCTTLAAIVIATIIGTWATNKLMPYWGEDPSKVVIDEMIGVWIPLLVSPAMSIGYALLSLFLFRFFDILKPLGIRALDKKHGAFWVMADDILAGIYSLFIVLIIRWII